MSSGSFQFHYNHTNENAAWHTNPDAKFILPEENVDVSMIIVKLKTSGRHYSASSSLFFLEPILYFGSKIQSIFSL